MTSADDRKAIDERMRGALALHFDRQEGSAYWLERAASLDFDPRDAIRSVDDLPRFGVMDMRELADRPLTDFLPRSVHPRSSELITAQTGGTLGHPVWTAYLKDEFQEAFIEPFLAAAKHVGFPLGGRWLYVGPTGPHIIGRAADAIARQSGSMTPFTVDFDSRWARKISGGSFAAQRYIGHIVEQSMAVLRSQDIDTLFTTPTILSSLAEKMTAAQRNAIRGVHYGGMAIDPVGLRRFQCECFRRAVHLAGYGNTLFGCCLELEVPAGRDLRYFPCGDRLLFGVLSASDGGGDSLCYDEPGRTGRMVFTRLDETMLLINVAERDVGTLVAPPVDAPAAFHGLGVASPQPRTEDRPAGVVSLY